MNDHEAEKIAAAMHVARPDWPATSILTMIRKHLIDRPRRDVFVAMAWVASEPNTSTPARVLENGPWWRAAGIEGQAHPREVYDERAFCGVCSKPNDRHPEDHAFVAMDHLRARHANADPDVVADAKTQLRRTLAGGAK